ncbi:MAG: hypothetical protein RR998_04680 [Oscillospiraceae bacterium]
MMKVLSDSNANWRYRFCLALACLSPLIAAVLTCALKGYGLNIFRAMPVATDEVLWYTQVKAVAEFGRPLGYFGYNGTHAALGTAGPWGIASSLPYALVMSVFGQGYGVMVVANIIFITLAIFAFAKMTSAREKDLLLISAICLFAATLTNYTVFSMAETLRYAVGILLSGMVVKLARGGATAMFKYIATPLAALTGALLHAPHAVFVPVLIYLVLDRLKPWARSLGALGAAGVAGGFAMWLSGATSAPFWREGLSRTEVFLSYLRASFPRLFVPFFGYLEARVLEDVPLSVSWAGEYAKDPYYFTTIAFMWVLFFIITALMCKEALSPVGASKKRKAMFCAFAAICSISSAVYAIKYTLFARAVFYAAAAGTAVLFVRELFKNGGRHTEKQKITLSAFALISLYILAFALLYPTNIDNYSRSMFCGVIALLFLIAAQYDKRPALVLLSLLAMIFPFAWRYLDDSYDANRFPKRAVIEMIETTAEELYDVMTVSAENSRWDNTVVSFTLDKTLLALPAGLAINYYSDIVTANSGSLDCGARYVWLADGIDEESKKQDFYSNIGYSEIYTNNNGRLLERARR